MNTISPTLTVIAPPDTLPVSLAEAKLQLRIDGSEQDAMLSALIEAALQHCQQRIGRSLAVQELAYTCPNAGRQQLRLPYGPVHQLLAVEGLAQDGTSTAIPASDYRLEPDGQTLSLTNAMQYAYWRITYRAGYDTETLPRDLRQAALHQLAALYEEGDASAHHSRLAERLLQLWKEPRI